MGLARLSYQGTLAERDGSVQLTSSLIQLVFQKGKCYFLHKKELI